MTILVVDDEEAQLEIMRLVLERAGYTVLAASSASEALEIFEPAPDKIDIVVTDVVMPGTDGPTLVQQLRAVKRNLRVLFISGFLAQYEWVASNRAGRSTRFLAKPFSPSALLQEVKKTLAVRMPS